MAASNFFTPGKMTFLRYSKDPGETLEIWDRNGEVLSDVVQTGGSQIQPDIIINRLTTGLLAPPTVTTSSAILAV
jgi:hypothetical protein